MSDNLLLDIIARSIGRTITQENYRQRAADVLRSVKENDLTLPQPTNLIEHEITRLRAENERLREAFEKAANDMRPMLRSMISRNEAEEIVRRAARAAIEGVTEPASPKAETEFFVFDEFAPLPEPPR